MFPDPLGRTNRGTLHPGQTVDIGSLADVIRPRVDPRLEQEWSVDRIDTGVTVTVIAISGQADGWSGAKQDL